MFDYTALLSGFLFREWDALIFAVAVLQAFQGILVALAIQKYGIVCRLILGALAICFCAALESILFLEPIRVQECLAIVSVITGASIYMAEAPAART